VFTVGVKKMKKLMHLLGLHGLGDTIGLGIQIIRVSAHMIFIMEISEAKVQFFFVFLSDFLLLLELPFHV
jgi:hypothetical protein